jgi:hypothetical protein
MSALLTPLKYTTDPGAFTRNHLRSLPNRCATPIASANPRQRLAYCSSSWWWASGLQECSHMRSARRLSQGFLRRQMSSHSFPSYSTVCSCLRQACGRRSCLRGRCRVKISASGPGTSMRTARSHVLPDSSSRMLGTLASQLAGGSEDISKGRQGHAPPQDHQLASSPVSGVSREANTPFPASRPARALSQPDATLSLPLYQLWLSLQALRIVVWASRPLAGELFRRPPCVPTGIGCKHVTHSLSDVMCRPPGQRSGRS